MNSTNRTSKSNRFDIVSTINTKQRVLFLSIILYTQLIHQCINYLNSIYISLCMLRNQEMDCKEGVARFDHIQILSLLFNDLGHLQFLLTNYLKPILPKWQRMNFITSATKLENRLLYSNWECKYSWLVWPISMITGDRNKSLRR